MVNVTLDLASRPGEPILVLVKPQSSAWELNFRTAPEALMGLGSIREADWLMRRCPHIGESAGAPVHWRSAGETATVMAGHDETTWDIVVDVPITTAETIVAQTVAGAR